MQPVTLYHLHVSLHCVYEPFLAATSSSGSQDRLLSTCSQSVLIFTRLGNTGTWQAWHDVSVMLAGEMICLGLPSDPSIWSVPLKQSVENQEGRIRLGNPLFVVQVSIVCTLLFAHFQEDYTSASSPASWGLNYDQHMGNMDLRLFQINLCTKYSLQDVTLFRKPENCISSFVQWQ